MAARNGGLFNEHFQGTQTRLQLVYIVARTRIHRHELHSGMGRTASWKRPSLARAWA